MGELQRNQATAGVGHRRPERPPPPRRDLEWFDRNFARLPLSVRPTVLLYPTTGLIDAAPGRIIVGIDGWLHVQADGSFADAQGFTNLDGVTWAVR
jgi:hypothetical protein